ncbi:hypothetical protein GCM10027347_44240 [Larkinella harenae]
MANVTFTPFLNDKANDAGLHLVMIRITYQRKHKYFGTSVYVSRKYFNEKASAEKQNWILRGHNGHETANGMIAAYLEKGKNAVKSLVQIGEPYTVDQIKRRIENADSDSFDAYLVGRVAHYKARKQNGTARNTEAVLKCVRGYLGRDNFNLADLTRSAIESLETWMLNRPTRRNPEGMHRNTVSEYLRRLHQHIQEFIVQNKLPDSMDPLRGTSLPSVPTNRLRLTTAELRVMGELELRPDKLPYHVRNIYLASYYLHGIRGGDIVMARVSQLHGGWQMVDGVAKHQYRFSFVSDKSEKGKTVIIDDRILPMLLQYTEGKQPDDFLFPFLKAKHKEMPFYLLKEKASAQVSYINKLLKKIAEDIGVPSEKMTIHTARHTFAEHVLDATGDIRLVQLTLQHSKIGTTERYTSGFKQQYADKANVIYRPEKTGTSD